MKICNEYSEIENMIEYFSLPCVINVSTWKNMALVGLRWRKGTSSSEGSRCARKKEEVDCIVKVSKQVESNRMRKLSSYCVLTKKGVLVT